MTSHKKREPYKSCPVCTFGYCAPNRCYCGHEECNAFHSYVDLRSQPFPGSHQGAEK